MERVQRFFAEAAPSFQANPGDVGIPTVAADDNALNGIIGQVFILVGALALLFLIFGAFQYITSNGDASQVQTAKNTMLYAIIGLIIAVSAFVIVSFVSGGVAG